MKEKVLPFNPVSRGAAFFSTGIRQRRRISRGQNARDRRPRVFSVGNRVKLGRTRAFFSIINAAIVLACLAGRDPYVRNALKYVQFA